MPNRVVLPLWYCILIIFGLFTLQPLQSEATDMQRLGQTVSEFGNTVKNHLERHLPSDLTETGSRDETTVSIVIEGQYTHRIKLATYEVKIHGSPWDGFHGFKSLFQVNASSPPDLLVCIVPYVDMGDELQQLCLYHPTLSANRWIPFLTGKDEVSACHDSFGCEWQVTFPDPPFGIIFYDLDPNTHDFVDAVIITGETQLSVEAMTSFNTQLLELIDRFATPPLYRPGEKLRRASQPFQRLSLDDCLPNCELHQSLLTIETINK